MFCALNNLVHIKLTAKISFFQSVHESNTIDNLIIASVKHSSIKYTTCFAFIFMFWSKFKVDKTIIHILSLWLSTATQSKTFITRNSYIVNCLKLFFTLKISFVLASLHQYYTHTLCMCWIFFFKLTQPTPNCTILFFNPKKAVLCRRQCN